MLKSCKKLCGFILFVGMILTIGCVSSKNTNDVSVSKVPGLGDVPILGVLFQSSSSTTKPPAENVPYADSDSQSGDMYEERDVSYSYEVKAKLENLQKMYVQGEISEQEYQDMVKEIKKQD